MLIQRAMLFAAGLGTRLRPLTEHTPKPLIEVGGRALIDYNLAHFAAHGCQHIVVNTHHHADQVAAHLRGLHCPSEIHISPEPTLLETGGGVVQALPLLGPGPFFSANSDAFWIDGPRPALARLAETFDPDRMDALLLLVRPYDAVGYRGHGDFDLDAAGQIARSSTPQLIFSGLQILHPRLFTGRAIAPFSLRALYQAAEQPDGRLARMFGLVHDAAWVHVGSPKSWQKSSAIWQRGPDCCKSQNVSKSARSYWLMKSEPDVYSVDDLAREKVGTWEGVRNYQARNHMRAMRLDDLAFFYHSSTEPPGIVGLMKVAREAYVDPTQFDPKSPYFDAKSKPEAARWDRVDVAFVEKLPQQITLAELREDPRCAEMLVIRRGMRLSVQPVEASHFAHLLKRAGAKTKLKA